MIASAVLTRQVIVRDLLGTSPCSGSDCIGDIRRDRLYVALSLGSGCGERWRRAGARFSVTRGKDEGGRGEMGGRMCVYCALLFDCLNRLVPLMYFATAFAISSIPNSVSIAISLRIFSACCASAHLSCAYAGQHSMKCSAVSSSSPHAGHLALSTLFMHLRYWLTGACPSLNCAIQLASMRLSSV